MTVDVAILRSRLVREHSVVLHIIGVNAVAWCKCCAQGRQQRVNRNVHNVIAEPPAIWPAARNHSLDAHESISAKDAQPLEPGLGIIAAGIRQAYAWS